MKIGYPCINKTIGCSSNRTFRLKSYSESRLIETVENNLHCLYKILKFNIYHEIFFFRITSDLVPFASHPINCFDWINHFQDQFEKIGSLIRENDIRISMHPDQFIVINSPDEGIWERSTTELLYHAQVLDALDLDTTAKIQLHIGGVYGNKTKSIDRLAIRFKKLPDTIQRRLVIENDDRLYTASDCLTVSAKTDIPVLFDTFHHSVNNSGETVAKALYQCSKTWQTSDGVPMVDYSSQAPGERKGNHAESLDPEHFSTFLSNTRDSDLDVMLEIKDKEASALTAITLAKSDKRFFRV